MSAVIALRDVVRSYGSPPVVALAVAGATASVVLPDGTRVEGVVETVGAPVSTANDDNTTTVTLPVRVSVADQAAVAGLVLATVTAAFESTMREDVLTVPVDALVPLDETRFAVEIGRAHV